MFYLQWSLFAMEMKCEPFDDSLSFEENSSVTFETFVKQEIFEDEIDAEVCLYFCFSVQFLAYT